MVEPTDRADLGQDLRQFITKIGMPLKMVASVCGLSNQTILDWWSGRGDIEIGTTHVDRICQFLGVGDDIIFNFSADFPLELIRQRLTNRPSALPPRFAEGALSPLLGLLHVAEMSALWLGTDRLSDILMRMHVQPEVFSRPETLVNPQFALDLFAQLAHAGMDDEQIVGLGRFISLSHQHNTFGHLFFGAESVTEVFIRLERHIDQLDQTLQYEFRFNSDSVEIESKPPPDFCVEESDSPRALRRFFGHHQKMLEWFPTLGGLAPITAEVVRCPLRGDRARCYRVALKPHEAPMPHLKSILGGGGLEDF